MTKLNFSIELPNICPWPLLRQAALVMDQQRWRGLWTYDHLLPCTAEELPLTVSSPQECEKGPIFEGWTLLSAMAALTQRVRLGTMVTSVTMRHPALLAKIAITLDHISLGRVDLGLGSGWHQREHKAFGIALGNLKERCDRFAEGAELLSLLLNGPRPITWSGQFYHLDRAPFAPDPLQHPLPLLIAGGGPKRVLPLVAKFAQASNIYVNMFSSFEEASQKLAILDQLCQEAGRDPRQIRKTATMYADLIDDENQAKHMRRFMGQHLYDEEAEDLPFGSAARIIEAAGRCQELGFDEVVFNGPEPTAEKLTRLNEEVLAAFD